MFFVFSCLGLLSCIDLCFILCYLVLFVSTFAKSLAGKTTLTISFVSKCFPYKDQIEEMFIVMVLFCIFPTQHFKHSL